MTMQKNKFRFEKGNTKNLEEKFRIEDFDCIY